MLEKCPVCGWKPITGSICPNCNSDLAPVLRALEEPRLRYQEGVHALEQGRLDEAVEILSSALAEDPRLVEARVALGQVYSRKGWPREAISQYDTALELDPSRAEVRRSRDEALEALRRAEAEERRPAARPRWLVVALPSVAFAAGLAVMALVRPAPPPASTSPPPAAAPVVTPAPALSAPQPQGVPYTLRRGDSLWKVARRAYGQAALWPRIQQSNPQLQQPHALRVGEQILLYPVTIAPQAIK